MTITLTAQELEQQGVTPREFQRANFSRQQAIAAQICFLRGDVYSAKQLIQHNPNFSRFVVEIP